MSHHERFSDTEPLLDETDQDWVDRVVKPISDPIKMLWVLVESINTCGYDGYYKSLMEPVLMQAEIIINNSMENETNV